MIYTLTLNPSLDYIIDVDNFKTGTINKTTKEAIYCGGKGINVSLILKELDTPSIALGFIAGFIGDSFIDNLNNLGIKHQMIKVAKGMTRINVKMKSNDETEINGMGPNINDDDFNKLKDILKKLNQDDILFLSGSIPHSMPKDTYEQIINCLNADVKIIIDTTKDSLLNCLKYKPFLIKPNHHELAEMFNVKLQSDDDIIHYALKLKELGAQNVLVSMADKGSILINEYKEIIKMPCVKGELISSVGAGDSMLAGFIFSYIKTKNYKEALKFATACGGASAFSSGIATKDKIMKLYKTVQS